jgi:hypothetical protein
MAVTQSYLLLLLILVVGIKEVDERTSEEVGG